MPVGSPALFLAGLRHGKWDSDLFYEKQLLATILPNSNPRGRLGDGMPPLFSLKGNLGHTLGATGLLQLALGLEFAHRRLLPPQAGLVSPMPGANVSKTPRSLETGRLLSLNVGFGGLNSAVALEAI